MSRILALDSSTDACSVSLMIDGNCLSIFELAAKSHTQRLLPMVDEVLQQADCSLGSLDAIAFGRGPGSFTGLRICMGIVQGLAFGADLPVIPVSTLAAMALGHYRAHPTDTRALLAALDARMDEVYWSLFHPSNAMPIADTDEQVMKPERVVEQVMSHLPTQGLVGVGSGWNYPVMKGLNPELVLVDADPQAENILLLAEQDFIAGKVMHVLDAQPVYLRDSVSWQKRQRIRDLS